MNEDTETDGNEIKILIFDLLDEELGLNIFYIRELLDHQEIHPLPKMPDFVDGVIDLRGHIIAVIDLRKRFSRKKEFPPGKHIIICKIKDIIVGLIVDKVNEIATFSEKEIQPVPALISKQNKSNQFSGIIRFEDRVITLLNLEGILTNKEISGLMMVK
jgi:purine-binding chemotaxis protein CheW